MWTSTKAAAAAFDAADPLAGLRARYNAEPGVLRLNGSSSGPLPRRLRAEHGRPGTAAPERENDRRREADLAVAELAPLIGADADEITLTESTSMNLFKALLAAARLRPDRRVLAVGQECFASDRYLARSAADVTGRELRLLQRPEDLDEVLVEGAAIVAISHTDIVSGGVREPITIGAEVHRHGALVLWDLSYSTGALRVDLHEWDADFAIGCGYRFLGGGAGAPAYSFVAARHHADLSPAGDTGHAGVLDPLEGGFEDSTSALPITELRAGLSILDGVAPEALETKTARLVEIFVQRMRERGLPPGMEIVPPATNGKRGSHVCVRHRHAQYLAHGLLSRGVVVDFVEPDRLRFSFAPAWLRHTDAWEAAEALHEAADELAFRR